MRGEMCRPSARPPDHAARVALADAKRRSDLGSTAPVLRAAEREVSIAWESCARLAVCRGDYADCVTVAVSSPPLTEKLPLPLIVMVAPEKSKTSDWSTVAFCSTRL